MVSKTFEYDPRVGGTQMCPELIAYPFLFYFSLGLVFFKPFGILLGYFEGYDYIKKNLVDS